MKMVVIIVAALAILGGGGAGVYFMFMQPAEAASAEVVDDSHAKEKGDHGEEDGHGSSMHFVELTPLILPIIDANGASQVISMVVALEVGSEEDAGKVEKMTPRLKDAYLQDMYGVLNKHAALKGGQIQLGFIKKRLNAASNRVLGDDVVQDVLLQVVQQRPI